MAKLPNWKTYGEPSAKAPPMLMPELIWRVLSSRGIEDGDEIQSLFNFNLSELKNPSELLNLDEATKRVVQAYEQKEKIAIYADFDMDGTPALALLYSGLKALGFENLVCCQPHRLKDGYGLHQHKLEEFQREGVKVVITVDVGITAVAEAKWAKENGIDLIITDHHLAGEELPDAYSVVNPNQPNCNSKMGFLCGTGVAFFLFLSIRRGLREKGLLKSMMDPKELLDCYAIGTITDLVPLIEDNRTLVRHGLFQLQHTKRPGLRSLLKALKLDGRELTSQDVAIRFAPKLNALSRMEASLRPIDIFLQEDEDHAKKMVDEVLRINQMRVSLQKTAMTEAQQMMFEFDEIPAAVFLRSASFHQGVIGLVAVRIAEEFGVPTFVGAIHPEKGTISGSCRIPKGHPVNLVEVLRECDSSLKKYGGHAAAAGFELSVDNAAQLEKDLAAVVEQCEKVKLTNKFDCVAEVPEIDENFMKWYQKLEPFGVEFDPIKLMITNANICELKLLRGGHVRVSLKQKGTIIQAVWFSPPQHLPWEDQKMVGKSISVVVEPQWNFFAGRKSVQLLIVDGEIDLEQEC